MDNRLSGLREKMTQDGLESDVMIPLCLIREKQLLLQISINLVSNAIILTPKNGQIDVRMAGEDDDLLRRRRCLQQPDNNLNEQIIGQRILIRFEITDTGCGISPELPAKIEDAQDMNSIGSGLSGGLRVVKQLVNGMSGSLEVESDEGRGTTFIAKIPFTIGQTSSEPTLIDANDTQLVYAYTI